ncbi:MAG: hydrolase [Myxococcota bacterium]
MADSTTRCRRPRRRSPRNRMLAEVLHAERLATLLFDALTPEEAALDAHTAGLRFDVPFLARRLIGVTEWALRDARCRELPLGYFGAGTGGAAALMAATRMSQVRAIASRGGRPDLAREALPLILAPTLRVVGERDREVAVLNREAQRQLRVDSALAVVPGASHLFEEPGALGEVARQAARWFTRWLGAATRHAAAAVAAGRT